MRRGGEGGREEGDDVALSALSSEQIVPSNPNEFPMRTNPQCFLDSFDMQKRISDYVEK